MEKKAYLLVLIGASFWGLIGIFVQVLYQVGFTSFEIVTLRVSTAAIMLVGYVYWKDKALLKINFKDLPYFIGTGIFSFVFFSWCYFVAIREISISVAVILLYTAPAFVAILSRVIFKELLTKRKLFALGLTIIGTALVVGFPQLEGNISFFGVLVGLGSGLGYALYSVFGKAALKKYNTLTITTYTFGVASLALLPISRLWRAGHLFGDWQTWLFIVGLGLIPTVLAYILYTVGLSYMESSKASITATIEPVVATAVGVFMYNEVLSLRQMVGMCFVLIAIILINRKKDSAEE